jgi:hypothetical protein
MDLSFSTSASVHLFFLRIALLIRTGVEKIGKAVKVPKPAAAAKQT